MILYRQIIRELVLPFIYALAIIIFIFMMQLAVQLLGKILYKGLDLGTIFELFCINSAWMLVLAVPGAVLVATLMAFGRISADSEILAIKASGQNLFYLILPVVLAAALLTCMLIFFHNLILPDANHRSANLMSDISRKKPAALIEPNILIQDFENYSLIVDAVQNSTGALKGVKIFADNPGEEPSTTLADSGTIQLTKNEHYLQLTLFDGETHSRSKENPDEYYIVRFKKHMIFIPNVDSRLQRTERNYRGDREKSAPMLLQDIREFQQVKTTALEQYRGAIKEFLSAGRFLDSCSRDTTVLPTRPPDTISTFAHWLTSLARYQPAALRQLQRHERMVSRTIQQIDRQDRRINQYLVEVHKKFSVSFACIVFVFIGVPLGIMAKNGGIAVGASSSIFFFVVYWAFLIGGENLADRLLVSPALAMWSCNIIIGIFGLFLILRMVRESTFISYEPVIRFFHHLVVRKKVSRAHEENMLSKTFFLVPNILLKKTVGTLPAYLIKNFMQWAAMVFLSLIIIFIVIDYISNLRLFETATGKDIILYYWYYLAWFIGVIFPIAMLLASMAAMGSLVKNSEITAMKAAGISVRRLTLPMLAFGLIISISTFYLGEKILPQANDNRKQLLEEIRSGKREKNNPGSTHSLSEFRRKFYYFGNKNTAYRFEEFRPEPQLARNVRREFFSKGRIAEQVLAHQLLYNGDRTWSFINGTRKIFENNSFVLLPFDTLADSILTATPEEMVARIKSIDAMSYWELKRLLESARGRGENVAKYQADLDYKIALPFMNFVVILVGLSITARSGKRGGTMNFGFGLGLVFIYWIFSQFILALGKNETLPPWFAAWVGNMLFFIIGLFLYKRAAQ